MGQTKEARADRKRLEEWLQDPENEWTVRDTAMLLRRVAAQKVWPLRPRDGRRPYEPLWLCDDVGITEKKWDSRLKDVAAAFSELAREAPESPEAVDAAAHLSALAALSRR